MSVAASHPIGFGVADPCFHSRIAPDLVVRSTRAQAIATGADSIWVPDHLMGVIPRSLCTPKYISIMRFVPSLDACYEPWTMLGRIAGRNRLWPRRLGVGVTDTIKRNPAITAQAAATLHQLSRGRAILGIGAGQGMGTAPYGIRQDRRVATFEEGVATVRALWDSGGRPVSRDSEIYPLREAVMAVPPYRGTRPEIWVGADGPRMRRAAGRYGDAWFPGVTMDAAEYGKHLVDVRDAAADAGRDPMAIRGAKYFFAVTAGSKAMVDELLEAPAIKSYAFCAPDAYWQRHGAESPFGAGFAGVHDLLPQMLDEQTALSFARQVPTSLIRNFVLAGTPAEILEQLADWRDQGLTYPVMLNMGFLQPSFTKGLRTNTAYMRVLRGIKKLGPRR